MSASRGQNIYLIWIPSNSTVLAHSRTVSNIKRDHRWVFGTPKMSFFFHSAIFIIQGQADRQKRIMPRKRSIGLMNLFFLILVLKWYRTQYFTTPKNNLVPLVASTGTYKGHLNWLNYGVLLRHKLNSNLDIPVKSALKFYIPYSCYYYANHVDTR